MGHGWTDQKSSLAENAEIAENGLPATAFSPQRTQKWTNDIITSKTKNEKRLAPSRKVRKEDHE